MKKGAIVRVPQYVKVVCWNLALKRRRIDVENGAESVYKDLTEDEEVNRMYVGNLGEFAFCMMFNLWPSFGLTPGGPDCVSHCGLTIDVKCSANGQEPLRVHLRKKDKAKACDIYALITGRGDVYTYRGCASALQLFDQGNLKTKYGTLKHSIDQGLLHDTFEQALAWRPE